MTPEDEKRIIKIENLLETLTETQVEQQSQILKLQESQKETGEQVRTLAGSVGTMSGSVGTLAGSVGSLASSVEALTAIVGRLADAQEHTETRLTTLIETVDRVVERLDGRR